MSKFRLEKKFPSIYVEKDTLEKVEKIILSRVNLKGAEEQQHRYSVTLVDPFGEETFGSITELDRSDFPNDLERIKIWFRDYDGDVEEVQFSLSSRKYYISDISIETNGKNARGNANSLLSDIERVLLEKKNLNWIFYGWGSLFPYIVFGAFIGLIPSSLLLERPISFIQIILVVIWFAWLLLKRISPYCVFDTQINRSVENARIWTIRGIFGAVVFGLISRIIWDAI